MLVLSYVTVHHEALRKALLGQTSCMTGRLGTLFLYDLRVLSIHLILGLVLSHIALQPGARSDQQFRVSIFRTQTSIVDRKFQPRPTKVCVVMKATATRALLPLQQQLCTSAFSLSLTY